jgi:hypothetical protein
VPKFSEKYELSKEGKNPSDEAIRRRQKNDLARAYRMLKEDPSGTANEAPVQRDRFVAEAAEQTRDQANLDDRIKQAEAARQSRNKSQRSPSFADFKEKDRQEENARAAIAERDGVYTPPKSNSAAANAERDGGPEYNTANMKGEEMKHGGMAKKYAKGGSVSASSYAKGGSINLSNCKVSTAPKNSSSPKW